MTQVTDLSKPHALLSVSDKTGIVDFARSLEKLDFELLSTGGTFKLLSDNGIKVTEVSSYTDFPEMMSGRVKTLHPKIHGGILGRRDVDAEIMKKHHIAKIDIVVVNLYPFAQTISNPDVNIADAIENIDIGGPSMVRSAAKNYKDVAIVTNPKFYNKIVSELEENHHQLTANTRYKLAVRAFEHTAQYDGLIAEFLGSRNYHGEVTSTFADTLNVQMVKVEDLRYGENPHQKASFYIDKNSNVSQASISTSKQLQGKALSYNNIADTDAALECVKSFEQPACVIVKHANPCGVAIHDDQVIAYQTAFSTDPESSFGGIIAFNRQLTQVTAQEIISNQFVEVIIAPSIEEGVLEIIANKKNIRLLVCGELPRSSDRIDQLDYKCVTGGMLVQDKDIDDITIDDLTIVTKIKPTTKQLQDLLFTWKVAQYVKSNAIVYGKDQRTIGIGAGQMSRVNSARIAGIKAEHAGLKTRDSVMASDAFFPFRDGIDNAAQMGIAAIIQPGGSIRDEEVIAAADEHGIAMVFTDMRHFRH